MLKERKQPSILQFLLIAGLIFFAIVFAIITINTGDILWFWPIFSADSQRILVHCYGEKIMIEPDDPTFEPINSIVQDSLSGTKRWDSLSMSDVTYAEYKSDPKMMVIELGYNPPARLHSFYKFFKNVDTLIIPLDGRHAIYDTIFGRFRGKTLAGSFHVEDTNIIMTTLSDQELCQKP